MQTDTYDNAASEDDDKKIDDVAKRILEKYRKAFEELAQ